MIGVLFLLARRTKAALRVPARRFAEAGIERSKRNHRMFKAAELAAMFDGDEEARVRFHAHATLAHTDLLFWERIRERLAQDRYPSSTGETE